MVLHIVSQTGGPKFDLPMNCLSSQKLYFWAGDQLNLVDLSAHITGLKYLQEQKQHYKIPESIEPRLLFSVPSPTFKFLII